MKKLVVFKIERLREGAYMVHYRNTNGGRAHESHNIATDELGAYKQFKANWERFWERQGHEGWAVELGAENES